MVKIPQVGLFELERPLERKRLLPLERFSGMERPIGMEYREMKLPLALPQPGMLGLEHLLVWKRRVRLERLLRIKHLLGLERFLIPECLHGMDMCCGPKVRSELRWRLLARLEMSQA